MARHSSREKISSRQMLWLSAGLLILSVLLLVASARFDEESAWHSLLHEPGFALLVALATWWGFELWRRIEDEREWAHRIEVIQKNVFLGVLGKDIPPPVLNEANRLILCADFVREEMDVVWTLYDHEVVDASGTAESCVLISARMEYVARNISAKETDYPLFVVLPNPRQDHFKPGCEISSIGYVDKDRRLNDLTGNVAQAYAVAREHRGKLYPKVMADYVPLQPGEAIRVFATYKMVKKLEDCEFQQTMMPTTSLKVTVVDRTSDSKRTVYARAIHSREMEPDPTADPRTYVFALTGSALPHQGIMIAWDSNGGKEAAPAGRAALFAAANAAAETALIIVEPGPAEVGADEARAESEPLPG
ncbi:MAG: hypothetical protein QOJ27_1587 [Sphingomonadales bacterium]|nr:hypothetical protein [Sphingomonadales bacterium]